MVKNFLLLNFMLPVFLFCGEFTASLNKAQINPGESFILNLNLKEVSAKNLPLIDSLNESFTIASQQQSSNTMIINGKVSSSRSWKFVLIPKKEGLITIPSISIDSSEGVLKTEPINIEVIKGSANSKENENEGLHLEAYVSNLKPYKNESFFYTIQLTSKQPLIDVQIPKFNIEDAIVEISEEPKTSEKVMNGVLVGLVEFNYLITPLKPGLLKIPATTIQGAIPSKRKFKSTSYFDNAFDFDPFAFMQGLDRFRPFALTTQEISVDVEPSVVEINPWIPAQSLKIEEIWDNSQTVQQGEFFNRGIKISAEGISSSQLPSLNTQPSSETQFKMYADKPILTDVTTNNRIMSSRIENYTLIPQQSGSLTLPELSITWWNVIKKEKVVTKIPARVLNVLPAKETVIENNNPFFNSQNVESSIEKQLEQPKGYLENALFYAIILALLILLGGTIWWGIRLKKKILILTMPSDHLTKEKNPFFPTNKPKTQANHAKVIIKSKESKEIKSKNEKLTDLNPT